MTNIPEDKSRGTAHGPAAGADLVAEEGFGFELVESDGGIWYVAHTRARNEKQLSRELTVLGVHHYLPLARRKTRSRNTGRTSRSLVPVFPGYVFFFGEAEDRYRALRTNRVAQVIDVVDQRQLVSELTHLHRLLSGEDDFALGERLKVGDWGRITAGPLRGLEGIVTQVSGNCRITINVSILGQSVSTEVDDETLERIDPPDWHHADARG